MWLVLLYTEHANGPSPVSVQFQVKQYSVFALISLANFPSAHEMCRGACCALWWSCALFVEDLIWKISTASFLSMFFKIGVHLLWCCLQWLSIEIMCFAEIVMKEETFLSTHALIDVLWMYFASAKLVWSWMASLVYLQVEGHSYLVKKKLLFHRNVSLCCSSFRKSKERQSHRKALKWITEAHLMSYKKKKKNQTMMSLFRKKALEN